MASEAFSEGSICQKGRGGDLGRKKSERQATVSCIGAEGVRGMKEEGMARKMTNYSNPAQRLTYRPRRMRSQRVRVHEAVQAGLGMQPESMHPSKEGFLSEEGRRTVAADRRKFIIRPSSLDPSDCCSSSSVPRRRYPPTSLGNELGAHKGGASA